MSVTRTALAVAALAAATLGLSACSGADASPSASPSVPDGSLLDTSAFLDGVEWVEAGDDGIPSLDFATPFELTNSATKFVADGDGAEIGEGDVLELDYVVISAETGQVAYSTYEIGAPEILVLSQTTIAPDLFTKLDGAHVGAQIIFGSYDQTAPNPDGSLPAILMAVTVTGSTDVLDQAAGTATEPAAGLPSVTVDAVGQPTIDFTGTTNPGELVIQPLIVGEGEPVAVGDNVAVHYTGWLWDGEQFDSSWDRGESAVFNFAEGQLIQGWTDGLAGQPVGSQVLLVIPPEMGYGDQEQAAIPAGSTLVFVVDILAAN